MMLFSSYLGYALQLTAHTYIQIGTSSQWLNTALVNTEFCLLSWSQCVLYWTEQLFSIGCPISSSEVNSTFGTHARDAFNLHFDYTQLWSIQSYFCPLSWSQWGMCWTEQLFTIGYRSSSSEVNSTFDSLTHDNLYTKLKSLRCVFKLWTCFYAQFA